jgi:hypothetical protein
MDWSKVLEAVRMAEEINDPISGEAKRAMAIAILNAGIDIPGIPEELEAVVFGMMVDFIIYLYNRWWGHAWLSKVKKADGDCD